MRAFWGIGLGVLVGINVGVGTDVFVAGMVAVFLTTVVADDPGLLMTDALFTTEVVVTACVAMAAGPRGVPVARSDMASRGAATVGNNMSSFSGSPNFCRGSGSRKTYRSGKALINKGVARIIPTVNAAKTSGNLNFFIVSVLGSVKPGVMSRSNPLTQPKRSVRVLSSHKTTVDRSLGAGKYLPSTCLV
jgi:hypothetical protein